MENQPTTIPPTSDDPQVSQPVVTQTPVNQVPNTIPPKSNKMKIVIAVVIAVVLISGGVLAYLHLHSPKTKSFTTQSTAVSSPATSYASELVYQPSKDASSSTTSIVGLDGIVKHKLTANANTATYDAAGFSQENLQLIEASTLITVDKAWSNFDVLAPDGNTTPVSSTLSTLLAGNAHPNSVNSLSNSLTVGKSTLLALETTTSSTDVKFVKIDLTTGTTTTLLTASATKQEGVDYTPIQPATASRDGNTVYLLANDAKLNTTIANGISLVTLDLVSGKFTLKTLPTEIDPSSATISKDGNLVAYETSGSNNGLTSWATHIYNVQTAKDTTVSGEAITIDGNTHGIRFSPDGAYLSEAGHYAADAKKAGMALQIISISSNSISHQVDLIGVQNQLAGFGWAGDHVMIYTTNSSSTGTFDVKAETTHSIDAASSTIFDFPKNLGELVAVLNYQQ